MGANNKTKKDRVLPVTNELAKYLREYLDPKNIQEKYFGRDLNIFFQVMKIIQ